MKNYDHLVSIPITILLPIRLSLVINVTYRFHSAFQHNLRHSYRYRNRLGRYMWPHSGKGWWNSRHVCLGKNDDHNNVTSSSMCYKFLQFVSYYHVINP